MLTTFDANVEQRSEMVSIRRSSMLISKLDRKLAEHKPSPAFFAISVITIPIAQLQDITFDVPCLASIAIISMQLSLAIAVIPGAETDSCTMMACRSGPFLSLSRSLLASTGSWASSWASSAPS